MTRTPLALAALLALSACGKTVEPTSLELGDLMLETFRDADFSDEDEEEALQARLLQLSVEIGNLADIEEVQDGRGVAPPILGPDHLDGLPEPTTEDGEPTNFEEQTPEAVAYRSDFSISDHAPLLVDTNQNCLGSNSTKFSDRRFTEGGDCFASGECAHASYESSNRTENPLAKVWIETYGDIHRTTIEIDDEDVDVYLMRQWIDQTWEGDGGGAKWRQRYVLDVWMPDPDDTSKTLKLYSMWSEASIPAVGTDLYRTKVREGIEEAFLNTDTFLGGEVCEDRDKTRQDWE